MMQRKKKFENKIFYPEALLSSSNRYTDPLVKKKKKILMVKRDLRAFRGILSSPKM